MDFVVLAQTSTYKSERAEMSDVEHEMDEHQRKLTTKTREIETFVAAEQNLGDLNLESTEYAGLRIYVGGEGSSFRVQS